MIWCVVSAWLCQPTPALAWGTLTHVLMGQRAHAVLVSRHPWLAAHREAFLWGAACADIDQAPGVSHLSRERTHSPGTVMSLWREAQSSRDLVARAFVLGWAAHQAGDEGRAAWVTRPVLLRELRAACAPNLPPGADPDFAMVIDLAVDAKLAQLAEGTLRELYVSAATMAGTPAGAPIAGLLDRVLGVDEDAYLGWARLQATMGGRGGDRYLAESARFHRVGPLLDTARTPAVRLALGDLKPLLTRGVGRAVERIETLLGTR